MEVARVLGVYPVGSGDHENSHPGNQSAAREWSVGSIPRIGSIAVFGKASTAPIPSLGLVAMDDWA